MQRSQVSSVARLVSMVTRCMQCVVLGALVLAGVPTVAFAQSSFPADWFFPDRPKDLVGLEGKPAPDLVTQAWIGDEVKLKAQKGKVVVVDFWATWCGPCMAAIPENVELVKEAKDKGLVFVGVHDANSGWDQAASVVKSKKINYSVAHDKGGSAKAYNVGFWPTYVVIDRKGVVRAAGLIPSHVKDVVKALLAESGPAEPEAIGSGNPAAWYLGGEARPSVLGAAEGKKLPETMGKNWLGKAVERRDLADKVTVITFFAPDSDLAGRTFERVKELNEEFASQGVAFLGVCDARMDWAQAKKLLEAKAAGIPVMQDLPVAAADAPPQGGAIQMPEGARAALAGALDGPVGGPAVTGGPVVVIARPSASVMPAIAMTPAQPVRGGSVRIEEAEPEEASEVDGDDHAELHREAAAPRVESGVWAAQLGIRLSPVTVVVDRRGVVRAAGVKADALKEIIGVLLAEPAGSSPAEDEGGEKGEAGGSTSEK